MKKSLILTLLLLLAASHVLAADVVKIAITGPFTGGSAPMGVSMRDGAKLAIAEINAAGGIKVGGRMMKIEVIERDDEAKNERGALIAQELASMDGPLRRHRLGEYRRGPGRRQASPGKGNHQDHHPRGRLRLHDPVEQGRGQGPVDLPLRRP